MVNSTETNSKVSSLHIEEKCRNFWSLGPSVWEAGMVSDVFSLEKINERKFYVKVGVDTKDKSDYYEYMVKNKHLHRLNLINNIGAVTLNKSSYDINQEEGNITVRIKAIAVNQEDNEFIENYLGKVFGNYKSFIKEWLAVYVYTNYKKLPTIILTGDRGVGKNTFAEAIQAIFPTLSETAKDLEGNFNGFAEKKLLIIDESASNGKVQYQMLKKFSGQKFMEVNHKYLRQYQVQNNLNIILLSNDESPIYVERDEMPTDECNNQFFVYRLQSHKSFDPDLQQKLIDRMGHYIRTELKAVYESLNHDGFRYSIAVPITDEEKKLFCNSVSDLEQDADSVIEYIENQMDDPSWSGYKFFIQGFLPSSFLDDILKYKRSNKQKVVQNLQKHGYISADKSAKHQVDGKRTYSYKLGREWLGTQKKTLKCLFCIWMIGIWTSRLIGVQAHFS